MSKGAQRVRCPLHAPFRLSSCVCIHAWKDQLPEACVVLWEPYVFR